jgi:anti-sigma factor RsiW
MDDIALHGHPAAIDLFAYLDGEVEASARTAIEAHLRDCPECAARLRTSSAWVSRIDSLPDVPLGRDLSPGVMRRIQGRGRFSPGILFLGAFQVAVAVALLWLLRDDIAGRLSQTAAEPWLESMAAVRLAFLSLAFAIGAPTLPIQPMAWVQELPQALPRLSLPIDGLLLLLMAMLVGLAGNGLALAQERHRRTPGQGHT